ncbi:hypothetical protein B0T18DRAFT_133693 [Schizothecium vesticola]|uniref:Uncharacterized protein n=1 Tax=Schizothecium vesticola TaxID=314040 RepID=A0AA40K4H0_9PEZI|nr:hypothetical protein B0T18DRAFT_133693 [Schizothecium vesticola]
MVAKPRIPSLNTMRPNASRIPLQSRKRSKNHKLLTQLLPPHLTLHNPIHITLPHNLPPIPYQNRHTASLKNHNLIPFPPQTWQQRIISLFPHRKSPINPHPQRSTDFIRQRPVSTRPQLRKFRLHLRKLPTCLLGIVRRSLVRNLAWRVHSRQLARVTQLNDVENPAMAVELLLEL